MFARVAHLNDSPSVLQSSHSEGESCLDSASVLSKNTLTNIGSSDRCECSVKGPKPASTRLKPVKVMSKPLTRVAIDIIGPVPCDVKSSNRFVLCMFDMTTHLTHTIPLSDNTSNTVASALALYFGHVFPEEICSDLRPDVVSALLQILLRDFNITHLRATSLVKANPGLLKRVLDLRNKLKAGRDCATAHATHTGNTPKTWYPKNTRARTGQPHELVSVERPVKGSPLRTNSVTVQPQELNRVVPESVVLKEKTAQTTNSGTHALPVRTNCVRYSSGYCGKTARCIFTTPSVANGIQQSARQQIEYKKVKCRSYRLRV